MARSIRKITVSAIRTPPPLPLQPLVDEVLRALDQRRRSVEPTIDSSDGSRLPKGPTKAGGRRAPSKLVPDRETRGH